MTAAGPSGSSLTVVLNNGTTSGMTLSLHPLPILNISDHYNRARLTASNSPKLIGALLGTGSDRNISILNSFELIIGGSNADGEDVDMSTPVIPANSNSPLRLNVDFLQRRREQFKETFPALDIVGWYSVGDSPNQEDLSLHAQISNLLPGPVFLLFNPHISPTSQDLPVTAFESALIDDGNEEEVSGRFLRVPFSVETGEAERIAVDGVSRGGMGSSDEEHVANLTTQRNAIRMLYDRLSILLRYVSGILSGSGSNDHEVLRDISGLVSSMPLMDSAPFLDEFAKEYEDVTLTAQLMSMIKQVNALSDFSEKHAQLYPPISDEFTSEHGMGPQGLSAPRSISRPSAVPRRRRG